MDEPEDEAPPDDSDNNDTSENCNDSSTATNSFSFPLNRESMVLGSYPRPPRPYSSQIRFSSVPGSPKRESRDYDFGAGYSTASEMSLYQSALDLQDMNRVDPRGSVYSGDHIPLSTNDALEGIVEEDGGGETPLTPKKMPRDTDLYFRDGVRRIDYVLSFNVSDGPLTQTFEEIRSAFEANLEEDGLKLERDCEEEKRVGFVKIHVPWDVLTRYAEIMKIKMPMREFSQAVLDGLNVPVLFPEEDEGSILDSVISFTKRHFRKNENSSASDMDLRKKTLYTQLEEVDTSAFHNFRLVKEVNSLYQRATRCFRLDPALFPPADKRFTYEFSREKDYLFDIPKNRDEFFTPSRRSLVVDFILKRTSYNRERGCDFSTGILKLLAERVYTAGYPLHEGALSDPSSPRGLLRQEWASLGKMHKMQPLDDIRSYFGVTFGLYFAWLGFYTYMLIPASIVGLVCFIYGCATLFTYQPSNDICEMGQNITMCPLCDKWCDFWKLNETCVHSRITYLCDNPATIIFAVFMSFWSAMFLELWKRYSANITYRWDLTGFDQGEEHPRPEYLARLSRRYNLKMDILNKADEPVLSFWKWKLPATIMSISVVLFLIVIALAAVLGVIFYRMSVMTALALQFERSSNTTSVLNRHAPIITTTTAALINLVCILIFNQMYGRIAEMLTELEMHRTQTEYDDSLTLKMFMLQFINYYASIFYIAFFKGKIIGHPGSYNRVFGYRQEECGPGGCLMELTIQLSIIMIGKQIMNTIIEMLMPKFWKFYNNIHNKITSSKTYSPQNSWERDYRLIHWETQGLFWEYLEMVLQFGFVTIFVAAFPLAPLFALLNNGFEMRLDAKKILHYYRRPRANRVKNIGIWYRILDAIGKLAVITNAFIIAFTSNYIPRMVFMHIKSTDGSLTGFLNHSLSYFNVSDYPSAYTPDDVEARVETCRYEDYRQPPWSDNKYDYTPYHWHLLAARLAFVVVFENVVVLTITLMRWIIPDVPAGLKETMRREAYIINEMIVQYEHLRAKGELQQRQYASDYVQKLATHNILMERLQKRSPTFNHTGNNVRRRSTSESLV